ncbi:MAG: M23 family metallopeptidase, partial [Defluviitaleaceae bacterium]|nr:M23 family metallopeptidase [Defluviitaleaceae bacterium]
RGNSSDGDFYAELGWRYPLSSRHISSGYKLPTRPKHEGFDIVTEGRPGAIKGKPVYSVHSGTVVVAGKSDSAGNWVVCNQLLLIVPTLNKME